MKAELAKMVKFSLVGLVNTGIDVALFALFVQVLRWHVVPANVVSYSTGILNSFLVNKFWTFRDPKPLSRSLQPFVRFVLINASSLALSTATVYLLAALMPEVAAKLCSVVVVFVWNYTLTRFLVFADSEKA